LSTPAASTGRTGGSGVHRAGSVVPRARVLDLFGTHERAVAPGAAFITKARVQLLRDFGACCRRFNAFLFLPGPRDAALPIAGPLRECAKVASRLSAHPEVAG